MTNTFGDWFLETKESTVMLDDGIIINIEIPKNRDNSLPYIPNMENHVKFSTEDICDFFDDLLHSREIIAMINDIPLIYSDIYMLNCDYCNITNALNMRRCNHCNKNMCNLCWEEKTEEIAVKNGAKNWNRRKDNLLQCFNHNNFSTNGIIVHDINCDICKRNTQEKKGSWYCNRLYDKDICYNCSIISKGRNLMKQYSDCWEKVQIDSNVYKYNGWGSFYDWIPIMTHEESFDTIFYNINKDSSNYHKVALASVDEADRIGIFIIPDDLESVCEQLSCNDLGVDCNSPIKTYLSRLGHPIRYG